MGTAAAPLQEMVFNIKATKKLPFGSHFAAWAVFAQEGTISTVKVSQAPAGSLQANGASIRKKHPETPMHITNLLHLLLLPQRNWDGLSTTLSGKEA